MKPNIDILLKAFNDLYFAWGSDTPWEAIQSGNHFIDFLNLTYEWNLPKVQHDEDWDTMTEVIEKLEKLKTKKGN
jgi:hypothetical protein